MKKTPEEIAAEKKAEADAPLPENAYKWILVRFDSEEDLRKFAKLVDFPNLSTHNKNMMFPVRNPASGALDEFFA